MINKGEILMSMLKENEKALIYSLIDKGYESVVLDFKREWYALFKDKSKDNYSKEYVAKSKFEFIKDCIAFLNVNIDMDKYIIIGVNEDKPQNIFDVVGTNTEYREEDIQVLLAKYIEPTPQIEIIKAFDYNGKNLDIIKIKKENRDRPYLFKENIENCEKNTKGMGYVNTKGRAYSKVGSSTEQLNRYAITEMILNRQKSIYGFFNINSDINPEFFGNTMAFLNVMNYTVNCEVLEILSSKNIAFKGRILETFENLLVNGGLFVDNPQLESNYLCKMILDNSNKIADINTLVDGGDHSFIATLFLACHTLYKILNLNYFDIKYLENKAILTLELDNHEEIQTKNYNLANQYISEYKTIVECMHNYKGYFNNLNFFKITEIVFDDNINEIFIQSDIKFKISDNVIELLMEPLYSHNNKPMVTVRELMQNSIDACRLMADKYSKEMKITLQIENDAEHSYLVMLDNGIGMNLDDISNCYLVVGKSNKKNSETSLIGKYGIGALTMFLIGNEGEITTRKKDDQTYNFKLNKESKQTSDLRIIKNCKIEEESFTEVRIKLNEKIESKPIKKLLSEFGMDNYFLYEDIHFEISYNNETFVIPKICNTGNFEIIEFEKCEVLMFNEFADIDENTQKENDKIIDKILKNKNQCLFNDMLVDFSIDWSTTLNLNCNNIPFLIIKGVLQEDNYSTELSRGKSKITGNLAKEIVKAIYKKQLGFMLADLKTMNEEMSKPPIEICNYLESKFSKYFRLPRLAINGKNVSIIISNSDYLPEKKRYIVYGNNISPNFVEISDDFYYSVAALNTNKKNLADIIEWRKIVCISKNFLVKFILDANSSSNGFRQNTLLILLKDICPYINWNEKSVSHLWVEIDENRLELKQNIEQNSNNGMYFFGGNINNYCGKDIYIGKNVHIGNNVYIGGNVIVVEETSNQFFQTLDCLFLEEYKNLTSPKNHATIK